MWEINCLLSCYLSLVWCLLFLAAVPLKWSFTGSAASPRAPRLPVGRRVPGRRVPGGLGGAGSPWTTRLVLLSGPLHLDLVVQQRLWAVEHLLVGGVL